MNELSLFTGAGGGLLGSILLGWKTIGAVEIEEYPCKVLEQRQRDGILNAFPIWQMDIREFNRRIASMYRGVAEVITGGDPCQANSAARTHGKRPESFALEFIEAIRIIRPIYVIRENPAKLRQDAPSPDWQFKEWLEDLGYTATIAQIKACCMGADHRRARMFVLGQLSNTMRQGLERYEFGKYPEKKKRLCKISRQNRRKATPRVYRKSDDVAHIVDRLKAIGNGQVPRMAEIAWEILSK